MKVPPFGECWLQPVDVAMGGIAHQYLPIYFFPVLTAGVFLVGFFCISLPDSLSAAESITCAFSDLSVLEKSQLLCSELICGAMRERFFFHFFLR